MKQKALIVESSRLFRNILEQIFISSGVDCHFFASGKEALQSEHVAYDFIIVSRTLDDMTGELFLKRFATENIITSALTVLLTTENNQKIILEANQAGYKLVFIKDNLDQLQNLVVKILNSRTLELDAQILLVEDSQSVANVITSLFRENRSTVDHVIRVSEMQEKIDNNDYDLVITDYHLHDKETGDDIITHIRNHEDDNKSSIPILVVTGEAKQNKRTSFLRNGANDFIIKPYDSDELLVRSSNLIKSHRLFLQTRIQQQQLIKLALTDNLTGLYNRHSLHDLGPKYISNAKRNDSALSMLVIDLDYFKKINDSYGHSAGDAVLKGVAAILNDNCRTEDIVARFGGEEFVMLLSNCSLEDAANKAEKLRKDIETSEPDGMRITTSIGVAQLLADDDMDSLFGRADKAVYSAKETGRNKVIVDS